MRFSFVWLAVMGLAVVSTSAQAASKDDQALKSFRVAMEEDYLDSKNDEAIKKLRDAADSCGDSGCSPTVKAKILMGLGVVLIAGKGDKDAGREAFSEALALDSQAAPDPDYVTSDVKSIFEEAKKKGGGQTKSKTKEPKEAPSSDEPLQLSEVPEQKVGTPIPIHVSVGEEVSRQITSVTLHMAGGREIALEKAGKAYRGNIPCADVKEKGAVEYWIIAKDKKGAVVGTIGRASAPLSTELKSELDDKPPSWPGFAPPEACGGGSGGDDAGSTHRQCIDQKDCPADESCTNNECLRKASASGEASEVEEKPTEDGPSSEARMNWIRLTFAPDFAMISGENVCGFEDAYAGAAPKSPADPTVICVRNPDKENRTRYLGKATPGQGNNVNFGFGVATMRAMLGYDRVLIKGLAIGARVGWAFNGTTEEFADFIPVHAEGRISYTIGADPFAGQVVRPWIVLSGGLAQVDTPVVVDVLEDGEACGAADPSSTKSPCTVKSSDGVLEPRIQTLEAIKQGGLGFAGGSLGLSIVPTDLFEINLGAKFSVTFPYVVPVLSPEAGVGFGF